MKKKKIKKQKTSLKQKIQNKFNLDPKFSEKTIIEQNQIIESNLKKKEMQILDKQRENYIKNRNTLQMEISEGWLNPKNCVFINRFTITGKNKDREIEFLLKDLRSVQGIEVTSPHKIFDLVEELPLVTVADTYFSSMSVSSHKLTKEVSLQLSSKADTLFDANLFDLNLFSKFQTQFNTRESFEINPEELNFATGSFSKSQGIY